jgi:hypothetical protein
MSNSLREPLSLLAIAFAALAVSAIHPYDRLTWVLEELTGASGKCPAPQDIGC